MKKLTFLFLLVLIGLMSTVPARAEDLEGLMKRVKEFSDQKNYAKALEELGWVQKELEKMHLKKIEEFFPAEAAGYKGEAFESNNVMGLTNLEREYTSAGKSIRVSLTGSGSSAGGALGGGLAGLGKMAAMMGAQAGMNTFRIAGRTATLEEQGSAPQLTVFLDSGSMLQLQGGNGSDLKSLAEALNIEKLDNYLRGQS